jgi:hypothetical protein
MFVITIREKLGNFAFMPSVLLVLLLRVVVVLRAAVLRAAVLRAAAVPPSITTTTNLRKNLVHRRNLDIITITNLLGITIITITTIPNLQDHQALMSLL